jgi:hypothetical protein
MSHNHTILGQMLQMFSRFEFQKAVNETKTEYHARGFRSWNHFVSMLFGQLSGQDSLRGIEAGLASQAKTLYHMGVRPVHRSTLSYANEHRSHELFKKTFEWMLSKCQPLAPKHKFRFKNPLLKDQVTGQIKTISIKVEGPISFVETTTSGEINPENLNRCFVIGIDESEEQTKLIHQIQRKNYTLEGYIQNRELDKIINKHIYAQRLLRKVLVFNPFAESLSFPTSKLKTRRDNEKFLRLINVICFLHQYQRKVKKLKLDNSNETIEYIECTPYDYKIAYELLSDRVLDNTLDDLPRPARKLLELIKKYLSEKSQKDTIPVDKIIFERREIREYTSWSFAQIKNNFRILKDYEYIQLIKAKNGLANQYRLSCNYSDLDFLNKILTPEELKNRITNQKQRKDLDIIDIPGHSGEKVLIS